MVGTTWTPRDCTITLLHWHELAYFKIKGRECSPQETLALHAARRINGRSAESARAPKGHFVWPWDPLVISAAGMIKYGRELECCERGTRGAGGGESFQSAKGAKRQKALFKSVRVGRASGGYGKNNNYFRNNKRKLTLSTKQTTNEKHTGTTRLLSY